MLLSASCVCNSKFIFMSFELYDSLAPSFCFSSNHKFNQFYRQEWDVAENSFSAIENSFANEINCLSSPLKTSISGILFRGRVAKKKNLAKTSSKQSVDASQHPWVSFSTRRKRKKVKTKVDVKAISYNWLLSCNWYGNPLISYIAQALT